MAKDIKPHTNSKGTIKLFPVPKAQPDVHALKKAPGGQFVKRHPQRGEVTSTHADGSTGTGGAGSQRSYKPMPKGSSRGR